MKNENINNKYIIRLYIIKCFIIIINSLIPKYKFKKNNNKNSEIINITRLIENGTDLDKNICLFVNRTLEKRIHPLDYEEELSFIISLILCKIPFSFIRFGDGEEHIMTGKTFDSKKDKWFWNNNNQDFKISLIKSSSIIISLIISFLKLFLFIITK